LERPLEAMRRYDRALKTARRIDDAVMVRIIQFNRANILTGQGKLQKAEEIYRAVGAEAREAGETRTYGMVDYSLGYLMLLRGEYGRAYETLDASRAIFEELHDPHYLTLAHTDLAELLVEINGFKRAHVHGRRARTLAERHAMRYEAARAALFQAMASLGMGRDADAATHLEHAYQAFRREGNRTAGALCAVYLAELEGRRGRPESARRHHRHSVEVFSRESMPLREAATLLRLARIEFEHGDEDAAREAMGRARRVMRRTHSPWLRAQADHVAAKIALRARRTGTAIRYLRQAIEQVESIRTRIGIDEFRISFSEDKAPIYADLVHALLERGGKGAAAEAFATVERARSRSLVDLLAGRLSQARTRANPEMDRLLTRLEKLQADANWQTGFRSEPKKGRRDETRHLLYAPTLRRREEEIADLVHRVQAKDAAYGALTAGETSTLADVRKDLPDDTTLVEYYSSAHGTLVFVVSSDDVRVVRLAPSARELADDLSRLRFHIEKWGYGAEYVRRRDKTLRACLDRNLRSVAARIWDPLEISTERVVVVPHGALHSLPFAALTGPDGASLAERHTFSYLPSATARRYLSPTNPEARGRERAPRVLAVGVGDRSIPQVEHEIDRVRAAFRRGRVLRGEQATKSRFREAAGEADVIHVATHGIFREDDPHFSALRFSDGWMSLYEFYGLELRASLVCVSACQSGRSWTGGGDELIGLTRGFLHAGTPTVVVSLWPVQDDSTAELMERFYGHLQGAIPAEDALRRAMLEVREERPNPYHWAPFVLIGRGGRLGNARLSSAGSNRL
jgi:CHAT domain-containing protein/tetratricopeptide (TPR) repeat protein